MSFKIFWTKTDEAPALASYCLLPILKSYTKGTGIEFVEKDISLAGRIIANFPDCLTEEQKIPDHLAELGELTQHPDTNIIKLPNISASVPQLKAAIKELQDKGYKIPDYPEEPKTDEEIKLKERFAKVLGSAVNPVLREGNSDRRAAASVKKFAQKYPHKMMKPWSKDSKTRVAHMKQKDFYGSEKSVTMDKDDVVRIEFVDTKGSTTVLKESLKLLKDEVVDSAVMNVKELRKFYAEQIEEAKKDNVLLSLHLKATMMKVSDPIMFGHAVYVYYKEALDKHADTLKQIGANVNNGLMDVLEKLKKLPDEKRKEIENDINKVYDYRPERQIFTCRTILSLMHQCRL
jgi:isocitrate dehydrogenase